MEDAVVVGRTEAADTAATVEDAAVRSGLLFASSVVGLALLDLHGRHLRVNAALCELLGRGEAELLATTWQEISHPDDAVAALLADAVRADTGVVTAEHRYVRGDGRELDVLVCVARLADAAGTPLGFLTQAWDVTDRDPHRGSGSCQGGRLPACRTAEGVEGPGEQRVLWELAFVDELTGLHNRRGFADVAGHRLSVAAGTGHRAALLFVDVDDMKHINDTLGHAEGDRALADVAGLLRATFRDSDLVGRWGGDEFCVLLLDADRTAAESAAERLRDAVDKHNATAARDYRLGVTVGTAQFDPRAPRPLEDLLAVADSMMYERKDRGLQMPRLLVVEDNGDVRALLAMTLAGSYDVVEAASAADALDRLAAEPFDVVLLDLHLPDVAGVEVARRARADNRTSRTPIVVLTADPHQETEAFRIGVDDYLRKPFDPEILQLRLRRLLRRRGRPPAAHAS